MFKRWWNKKEPVQAIGLGLIGLAEDIVIILSLGFIVPCFRAWYLFDFLERFESNDKK